MIRFFFNPTPNPEKVALFLEQTGLPYEVVPVDTSKGDPHTPEFREVNPNVKVPAIIDTEGPGGTEARVLDSTAILLYLAEKTGKFLGAPAERAELLSWLMFIASGVGPFSGQAVHFQYAAPESLDYTVNRYRREVERHYRVLDRHLAGREYFVGAHYTIVDISAWGWLDRAGRVLKGEDVPLASFPISKPGSNVSTPGRLCQRHVQLDRTIPSKKPTTRRLNVHVPCELSGHRALRGTYQREDNSHRKSSSRSVPERSRPADDDLLTRAAPSTGCSANRPLH